MITKKINQTINQDIIDALEHNLLADLKRKDLSKEQRKIIVEDYKKRHNMGYREIAKEFKIPYTTLYYWVETTKKKEQCDKYVERQYSDSLTDNLEYIKRTLESIKRQAEAKKFKDKDAIPKLVEIYELMYWIKFNMLGVK